MTHVLLAAVTLAVAIPTSSSSASLNILETWPGSWSCTDTASNQRTPVHYRMDATVYGTWLQFSADYPGENGTPARKFTLLIEYSTESRKWFIISFSSLGHFLASESSSGPNAMKQTWVNIYPVDPSAEPGVIMMRDNSYETFDAYKANGKRITLHTVCARQGTLGQ